jgi:ribosomal protein L19
MDQITVDGQTIKLRVLIREVVSGIGMEKKIPPYNLHLFTFT